MAVKHLKKNVYVVLDKTQNNEFERKQTRAYFDLHGLTYKGNTISVAVPLRANINRKFQQNMNEIVPTAPTLHTRPGFISGWHITKMIPFYGALYTHNTTNNIDLILAEKTAAAYIKNMKKEAQNLLNRLEQGENIFGAIEFDYALQEMSKMASSEKINNQLSKKNKIITFKQIDIKVQRICQRLKTELGKSKEVAEKDAKILLPLAEAKLKAELLQEGKQLPQSQNQTNKEKSNQSEKNSKQQNQKSNENTKKN